MAKRSGLTILELLVALVSVAIVLTVLFRVAKQFREGHGYARQSSCISNVKHISLIAMYYAQDYDERYPASGFAAIKIKNKPSAALTFRAEKPENAWYETLSAYAPNGLPLYCPSDEARHRTSDYPAPAQSGEYAASYTMNKWAAFGLKTAEVKYPPEFILFAERNNETLAGDGSYLFAPWTWSEPQMAQNLALTRHSGGSNVGLADGHSKWYKSAQMLKLRKDGAFQP